MIFCHAAEGEAAGEENEEEIKGGGRYLFLNDGGGGGRGGRRWCDRVPDRGKTKRSCKSTCALGC